MLLNNLVFSIIPILCSNWVKLPNSFLSRQISERAFKTIGFNYAIILANVNTQSNLYENLLTLSKNKKIKKKERWMPVAIIHLVIAACCIGSTPNKTKIRPTIIPALLFSSAILGSWWTALKAPKQLSWSWDPVECALLLSALIGINYTHISGRVCESLTRTYVLSITPRLVRGGMLRTGHHAKVKQASRITQFKSEEYYIFNKKYNTFISLSILFLKQNLQSPFILKKNYIFYKKVGPTLFTHILILLTLILFGWSSWNNNLPIGGLILRLI